jgi:hypothetical protein
MQLTGANVHQTHLHRTITQMTKVEKSVIDLFNSPNFMDKYVQFMSVEEIKGKDPFNASSSRLIKVL